MEAYDLVRNNLLIRLMKANPTIPNLTLANGFPTTASTGFPVTTALTRMLRLPYVQQWSAGFQRDIGGGTIVEVSYVGSKGTHLVASTRGTRRCMWRRARTFRRAPAICSHCERSPISDPFTSGRHIANSSYNSLQIKSEKRFSGKLSFLTSFVWSKSIDDADSIIPGLGDSSGAQDERNLRLERGLSVFNVGRRVSAGFVYNFGSTRFLQPAALELGKLRDPDVSGWLAGEPFAISEPILRTPGHRIGLTSFRARV